MATIPLEGLKVVTAQEMARIEELAYAEGASELSFMEKAGAAVAKVTAEFIQTHHLPQKVTLLVGKGNNGGDAYAAGVKLLEGGYPVTAWQTYPLDICSPLCKRMQERFRKQGGVICRLSAKPFVAEGIILDGLVGTGFRGKADETLSLAIENANRCGLPILAIDIPSGVNGTTGEVETVAIQATETIFLGLPKSGFFLKQGWDHVGKLRYASFGLAEKYIAKAKPVAHLLNEQKIAAFLPPLRRSRHKYQAGYVLAVAGSPGMPGAALLASFAALRTGAGIVRLFHPAGMQAELSSAPYELIRQEWDGSKMAPIRQEARRAKALLLGPGIGRTKKAEKMVKTLMNAIDLPMVIDADALFIFAENSSWKLPPSCVLTPHHGEMEGLLAASKKKAGQSYLELCQSYVEEKQATLVLKGAPNFLFSPGTMPLVITRGDPGMATAGAGDVLTGMIAALLAQGLNPRHATALAVYLHGRAGEIAATTLTSYCLTASDLIEFLPDAFYLSVLRA